MSCWCAAMAAGISPLLEDPVPEVLHMNRERHRFQAAANKLENVPMDQTVAQRHVFQLRPSSAGPPRIFDVDRARMRLEQPGCRQLPRSQRRTDRGRPSSGSETCVASTSHRLLTTHHAPLDLTTAFQTNYLSTRLARKRSLPLFWQGWEDVECNFTDSVWCALCWAVSYCGTA